MKTRIALVTLLSAILVFPTTGHGLDGPPKISEIRGLSIFDGESRQNSFTLLRVGGTSEAPLGIWCSSTLDPDCEGKRLHLDAFLVPCSNQKLQSACIESFFALDANGNRIPANFVRIIDAKSEFDTIEDTSSSVISGQGSGGLWEFSQSTDISLQGLYVVQALVRGYGLAQPRAPQSNAMTYQDIDLGIAAVTQVSGNFGRKMPIFRDSQSRGTIQGFHLVNSAGERVSGDYQCHTTELGVCYSRRNFPTGFRFGMEIKVPDKLFGWFHGRIHRGDVEEEELLDGSFQYTFVGLPVEVPLIEARVDSSSWTDSLVQYVENKWAYLGASGGYLIPGNSTDTSFELTRLFLPLVRDTSTREEQAWSVRTLGYIGESIVTSCSRKSSDIAAILSTNAMVYSPGPPEFSADSGYLTYKVLSPHYSSKSTENLGTYDLLLKSEIARCIYGFSNTPIRAEVEIIGNNGVSKVSTTVISEKAGYLSISVSGFNFSEPTVRVKISQILPLESESSTASTHSQPTSSNQISSVKKLTSVTCRKGSVVKRINKASPRCPKGYTLVKKSK